MKKLQFITMLLSMLGVMSLNAQESVTRYTARQLADTVSMTGRECCIQAICYGAVGEKKKQLEFHEAAMQKGYAPGEYWISRKCFWNFDDNLEYKLKTLADAGDPIGVYSYYLMTRGDSVVEDESYDTVVKSMLEVRKPLLDRVSENDPEVFYFIYMLSSYDYENPGTEYLIRSAEMGFVPAMMKMAEHLYGERMWAEKIYDLGYTSIAKDIADTYSGGCDWQAVDVIGSIKWLEKDANDNNNKDSMLSLAAIYQRGLGVPVDNERAHYWLDRAYNIK